MHALPIIAIILASAAFLRTRRRSWSCAGSAPDRCHTSDSWSHPRRHRWHHGRRHRGRGLRRWLHWWSEELDLSPAQEKLVRTELQALRERFSDLREEGTRTREQLADAVRDTFDEARLTAMFGRHDEQLASVREQFIAALGRLHEVLDEVQRHKLAELIGGSRTFWGPYR